MCTHVLGNNGRPQLPTRQFSCLRACSWAEKYSDAASPSAITCTSTRCADADESDPSDALVWVLRGRAEIERMLAARLLGTELMVTYDT